MRRVAFMAGLLVAGVGGAASAQDKYTLKVPGGLAFSEFRGYESWELVSLSQGDKLMAAILANPAMIAAYKKGIPANGRPFPDGAKMAKVHWTAKQSATAPGPTTVPGELHDVDFMVKDGKRFADSGGWGYAAFRYDAAAGAYRPQTTADAPPQANDAKCGFGCHTLVKSRDFVFTEYGNR
ncbi:MAG TPA: cytochrome P460 family protein [Gemmatimonadales bacterium]|nr:cytochrome P460 family protein [Gemmatimonadales bacterium]